jgi:hypothetical protein
MTHRLPLLSIDMACGSKLMAIWMLLQWSCIKGQGCGGHVVAGHTVPTFPTCCTTTKLVVVWVLLQRVGVRHHY